MPLRSLRLFLLIAVLVPIACKAEELTIVLDPGIEGQTNLALWLAYAGARKVYIEKHPRSPAQVGEILPSFDEEVSARLTAIGYYRIFKEKETTFKDSYWETLSQIEALGFLKPYIWKYHHLSTWPANSKPSNMAAFETWASSALAKHAPQTRALLRTK